MLFLIPIRIFPMNKRFFQTNYKPLYLGMKKSILSKSDLKFLNERGGSVEIVDLTLRK